MLVLTTYNMNPRRKALIAEREWLRTYKRGWNRGASQAWKARNNRHLPRIAVRN